MIYVVKSTKIDLVLRGMLGYTQNIPKLTRRRKYMDVIHVVRSLDINNIFTHLNYLEMEKLAMSGTIFKRPIDIHY